MSLISTIDIYDIFLQLNNFKVSGWLQVPSGRMQAEWKWCTTGGGEPSVTMAGQAMMHKWCASKCKVQI